MLLLALISTYSTSYIHLTKHLARVSAEEAVQRKPQQYPRINSIGMSLVVAAI